jgi:hypothetical protein
MGRDSDKHRSPCATRVSATASHARVSRDPKVICHNRRCSDGERPPDSSCFRCPGSRLSLQSPASVSSQLMKKSTVTSCFFATESKIIFAKPMPIRLRGARWIRRCKWDSNFSGLSPRFRKLYPRHPAQTPRDPFAIDAGGS